MPAVCPESEREENAQGISDYFGADLVNGQHVYTRLLRLFRRYANSMDEARELFADFYIKLHSRGMEALKTFLYPFDERKGLEDTEFRKWILRSASNLGIDHVRKKARNAEHHMASLDRCVEAIERGGFRWTNGIIYEMPEELAIRSENLEILGRCVQELSSEDRYLIERHYRNRDSYHDLADQLGVPVGTVKTKVHGILGRLRNAMGIDLNTLRYD